MLIIHDSDNVIIYTNVTEYNLDNIVDHDSNDEIIRIMINNIMILIMK